MPLRPNPLALFVLAAVVLFVAASALRLCNPSQAIPPAPITQAPTLTPTLTPTPTATFPPISPPTVLNPLPLPFTPTFTPSPTLTETTAPTLTLSPSITPSPSRTPTIPAGRNQTPIPLHPLPKTGAPSSALLFPFLELALAGMLMVLGGVLLVSQSGRKPE